MDDVTALHDVNMQLAKEIAENAQVVKEAKSAKRKCDADAKEMAKGSLSE